MVFNGFLKVWDPEWKPNRRKSGQEGHVESKLGCFGRSWLQVGRSWEMLGARWSQGSNQERQDESPEAAGREDPGGVEANRCGPGAYPDSKILSFKVLFCFGI